MKIIDGQKEIDEPICISLGNFDGLHVAHRKLIEKSLKEAKKLGVKSAVLTFNPHPKEFFWGRGPEQILPHHIKDAILSSMGIDYLIVLPFNEITATMEPRKFVEEVLLKRFKARSIFVGYNYHFGDKQKGNVFLLEDLKAKLGFDLFVQNEVRVRDHSVSSTIIRDLIKEGKVDLAGALLGYYPMVEGLVVKGNQLGHALGYPTANLTMQENLLVPREGVYMGYVKTDGAVHKALINVGERPTIDENLEKNIEAHLLDFNGSLYGKTIQISFTERMRDEKKFNSLDDLRIQLKQDEKEVREKGHHGIKNIALFPDSLY